jgi:DNA-binding NtrC family response regulator
LSQQVQALERSAVAKALALTGGNKVAAAKMLGVSRAKLYQRLA